MNGLRAGWIGALESTIRGDGAPPPLWLAFGLSLLALACKAPDTLLTPQFWAEDGSVFFAQQLEQPWPPLLRPYAGYLLVIPRLIAFVARPFSAVYAPAIYAFGAWIVGSLSLASLRCLKLGPLPFVFALGGVVLTPTNGEVFGTLTNVHWLLQFYLLVRVARFARGEPCDLPWLRVVLALCIGLTGPFGIFAAVASMLVLAIGQLTRRSAAARSTPRVDLELAALCFAAGVQVLFLTRGSFADAGASGHIDGRTVARVVSLIQLHAFTQELLPRWLFRLCLITLAVLAWLSLKARNERLSLLGIYAFVAVQMAGVVHKFAGDPSFALAAFHNGDRYFVAIKALLFWLLCLLALWRSERFWLGRQALTFACVGASMLAYAGDLRRPAFPDLHWREHAVRIDAGEAVTAPILPVGWTVVTARRSEPSQTP